MLWFRLSLKHNNLFSGATTLLGKKTLFIPLACLLCRRELDFPEQPFCYHRDRGWEVGGPPSLCSLIWELYNKSWGTAYPCSTDKQTCLVLAQRCSETCRRPTVSRRKNRDRAQVFVMPYKVCMWEAWCMHWEEHQTELQIHTPVLALLLLHYMILGKVFLHTLGSQWSTEDEELIALWIECTEFLVYSFPRQESTALIDLQKDGCMIPQNVKNHYEC